MSYSLTIETDDPDKIRTLIVVADILLKGDESELFVWSTEEQIGDFLEMLGNFVEKDYVVADDFEALMKMSGYLEGASKRMRKVTQMLNDA
jgi:hypothetical protein